MALADWLVLHHISPCWVISYQSQFNYYKKVKLVTLVKGDSKAPFSIATTLSCSGGHYFFPWIALLYPWYHIIFINPSARAGYDTRSIFKVRRLWKKLSVFSFDTLNVHNSFRNSYSTHLYSTLQDAELKNLLGPRPWSNSSVKKLLLLFLFIDRLSMTEYISILLCSFCLSFMLICLF